MRSLKTINATWCRANSLEKTLMLGKTEGRRRGWQRIRWLDGITNPMDMGLGGLRELVNREAKYWSFNFNISPSNEHPGLISFRMEWLDILAVRGTLKSLLQHHSSKVSVLRHSAFFLVQLSHPYLTTGKTIALDETDLCWQSNASAFFLNYK